MDMSNKKLLISKVSKRIMAYVIDMFLSFITGVAVVLILARLLIINETFKAIIEPILGLTKYSTFAYLSSVLIYYVVQEGVFATTIGKKIMGLKVISFNGLKPKLLQIIVRNIFRITDVFLYVGSITVAFDKEQRRLGDIIAKTKVIETRDLSLK